MKILKSQPIKRRAIERLEASAALLARSCFIVSTKLCLHPAQLAFLELLVSFVLAGFMRQRMNAAKPVRTQSIIHNTTCWNKSSVNC
jgi:hypothetical protein